MARSATFTTYVNAQLDPGLEQAYARQASIAQSSYATITQAAQEATRATAGLLGAKGTTGVGATPQIQAQVRATKDVTAASADAERATARLSTSTAREGVAATSAARNNEALARSLNTTSLALNVVEGRLSPVAGRLATVAKAASTLAGTQLGLVGFAAALFAVGRVANEYTNLTTRLRPFFDTQSQANQALQDVVGIAGRSRSALEPIVELYASLTSRAKDFGISQAQISRATEIASKATTLSGGSAEARRGALIQFSQAVGANFRGSGQEFQSLAEGAPQLLAAIAKGFKNVDGSIGTTTTNLRLFASDGKLSTQQVLDALDRVAPTLERQFATIPNTLGSGAAKFANAVTVMIGQFDSSAGFTRTLADALVAISENLRAVIALAVGVGGAFAAIKLGGLVSGFATTISSVIATQAQVKALDAAWVEDAAAAKAASIAKVAALEAEQIAIAETIAILERKRVLDTNDVIRASQSLGALGPKTAQLIALEAAEADTLSRLNIQREAQIATTEAVIVANSQAAASSEALAVATATTGARVGAFRGALGSVASFLGGPWGIAIGVAVTALFLFNTATSSSDKLMQDLKFTQDDVAKRFHNIAQAADHASQSTKDFAKAQILQGVGEKRRDVLNQYNDVRLRVGAAASRASSSFDGKASSEISAAVGKISPTTPVGQIYSVIQGLSKKYPSYFRDRGIVEKLIPGGADSSLDAIRKSLATADTGRDQFNKTVAAPARADLAELNKPPVKPGPVIVPKTPAQISAAARQQSAATPLASARADLAALNAQRNSKTGLLPGKTDVETQNELAAAMQRVTAAQEAQSASRKAATAGRVAERKAARDAIQDQKDEAKAREDAALLALEKKKPSLNDAEYTNARIGILKTYDDELKKIDASAAASHSAAEQQIADVKRIQAEGAANATKRDNILGKYSGEEKPTIAADRARRSIQDLVDSNVDGAAFFNKTAEQIAEISKINPLGTGIYTQAQADADTKRINEGVRKPLTDLQRDFDRGVEIAKLQLSGRDAEASALSERNRLLDQGVEITGQEFLRLQANYTENMRINDALASRQRITGAIENVLSDTRQGFAQLLVDLPSKGGKAGLDFVKSFQQNVLRVSAQEITEKIFAGSDEKLRGLISGKSAVDQKIDQFAGSIATVTSTSDKVQTGFDKVATAAENLASRLDSTGGGVTGGGTPTLNSLLAQGNGVADRSLFALLAQGNGVTGPNMAANDNGTSVITGQRRVAAQPFSFTTGSTPGATAVAGLVGKSFFSGIDKLVDKITGKKTTNLADGTTVGGTTFFGKLGDSVGAAFAGAGKGAIASGVVSALGIQQNQTGAAVGGAVGGLLKSIAPISAALGPFGAALAPVLGIVGGFVGNLFNKPKYGSASVSLNAYGEAVGGTGSGNSAATRTAATGAAKSVADGVNQIVSQLGATITNLPALTIGSFDGKARVATTNTSASLNYNNFNASTLKDFGKDGDAAAVQYAIEYSIQHGVINGISAASKKILASGQDLTQALNKATVIESIPKRLLQLTDPVKYAVQNLNDEFTKMISYLNEGGATAQQYADAQKLYDLSRAEAIKTATSQASDALKQFLENMVSSSSSPLNKLTTYQNASTTLNAFKGDIASGKSVDQNDLITAAKNFQDASQALNGSSSAFFDDFDALRALLTQAKTNIDGASAASASASTSSLPASPFASDAVQAAIGNLASTSAAATQAQTDTLGGKLDALIAAVNDNGSGGAYDGGYGSSVRLLPGFNQ